MRPVVGVAAGVLLVAACQPPPAELTEQDRAALEQVIDDVARNLEAADFATWAGRFSQDAVIYSPNAPAIRGRTVIQEWGESFPPIQDLTWFDVQVWGQGDLAYGTSGYAFTVEGFPPDTGKQLWAFRRAADGRWEIVAVSYNSDLPVLGEQE
jgi:ketosteroid isomerase-like protein